MGAGMMWVCCGDGVRRVRAIALRGEASSLSRNYHCVVWRRFRSHGTIIVWYDGKWRVDCTIPRWLQTIDF